MKQSDQQKQRDEEIRSDWAAALASVDEGEQLSMDIGWGFSDEDIKELARLHKNGQYQGKIECLLVDCNFLTEAMDFGTGKYEAYL